VRKARKVRESAPSNFMVRSSGKPHSDFAGYAKPTLARLQSKRDTGRRQYFCICDYTEWPLNCSTKPGVLKCIEEFFVLP